MRSPSSPLQAPRASGRWEALGRWLAYVAFPLLVGAAVYLVRGWGAALLPWRRVHLARVVLGTLPDAAWAFAIGACVCLLWRNGSRGGKAAWVVMGCALAVGYEAAQGLRLVPGTFDPLDLVTSAAAFAAAVVLLVRTPSSPARTSGATTAP